MAQEQREIKVTIENNVLHCTIPLTADQPDDMMAKITTYGALKLAEEQASIFYMQRQMRRGIIKRPGGPIIPGVA